jgi:lipid A 3-O-deacylase
MKTGRACYLTALILATTPSLAAAQMGVPDQCKSFKTAIAGDLDLLGRAEEKESIESSSHLARTFIWENDMFAGGGDIHYTNGMKLSWLHSPCRHRHESLKKGYRSLLEAVSSPNTQFRVHSGGLVGMNMYTPRDKDDPNRVRTDRPYAGWVYVGWNLQAARIANGELTGDEHQLELQLGFTGGKTAQREIQEYIHRNISDSRISQGWDHQIGQRIGVNALYAFRKDLSPRTQSQWLRFVPHAGFNLGNLMQFVNAGGMVMLGRSAGDYPGTSIQPLRLDTKLMREEVVSRVSSSGEKTETVLTSVKPAPVLYVFAGLDARYIFSSVFVEGFGASKHDIELKHGVYDLMGGIAWGNDDWRLSYKVIHRSKEFSSPDPSKETTHRIGQISLTWFY